MVLFFGPLPQTLPQSLSPSVISTSGGFRGEKSTLSWTAGETVIHTLSADSLWLTQGFQQSRLEVIPVDTGSTNTPDDTSTLASGSTSQPHLTVYPNPVDEHLILEVNTNRLPGKINIYLYNATGTSVYNQSIALPTSQIDLQDYPPGIYFLHVLLDNRKRVYKIIKK